MTSSPLAACARGLRRLGTEQACSVLPERPHSSSQLVLAGRKQGSPVRPMPGHLFDLFNGLVDEHVQPTDDLSPGHRRR